MLQFENWEKYSKTTMEGFSEDEWWGITTIGLMLHTKLLLCTSRLLTGVTVITILAKEMYS